MRAWFGSMRARPQRLVEPFAGGAGVGLSALMWGFVDELLLVELDAELAHFWQVVFGPDAWELADRVSRVPTRAAGRQLASLDGGDEVERALQTLLKLRLKHNGILKASAGWAPDSPEAIRRWPVTVRNVAARIRNLSLRRASVSVVCGDGALVLRDLGRDRRAAFFIDPPYPGAGQDLYEHWRLDHEQLMSAADGLYGEFLMTHEDTEVIQAMASRQRFGVAQVARANSQGVAGTELLISRDLRWLQASRLPRTVISAGRLPTFDVRLDWVTSFVLVVEEGNFDRAGARQGLSQAQVSKNVRELERMLAVELFDRDTKPAQLTAAGERLYGDLRRPLAALDRALGAVRVA